MKRRFPCLGDSIINFGGNVDKMIVKNICHFSWFINDLAIMNYLGYGMNFIIFMFIIDLIPDHNFFILDL